MTPAKTALPLHKHPQPHKELLRRHRHYWMRKDFRISASISIVFFWVSVFVSFFAIQYATERASNPVTDIILSNFPAVDVDGLFVYGTLLLIAFATIIVFAHPKRIPFTLYSLTVFYLIRSGFISLTHIGPFPVQTENAYDLGAVISRFLFSSDLFFSAHTGVPFLLALIFWREKTLRCIFLAWSVFLGTVVLLGHLHYTIDVVSAFFITYTIYKIAEFLFRKERALFHADMPEDVPLVVAPVIRDPQEKRIFQVFEIAVVLKGLNALLEIVLGLLLMFTNVINEFVAVLVHNEFIEDPNDFIATHIQALLPISPHAQFVGALYLLSHGVVKIFLMAGLLRNKLWAYPSTIVVLSLLILYQLTRFFWTHSPWLIVLSAFDTFVVWLVWHEYKRASRARA